jgi:uncharacterized membrane protein
MRKGARQFLIYITGARATVGGDKDLSVARPAQRCAKLEQKAERAMMDPHSLQEKLRPKKFVMMILWTAMVGTVLLFVGLAYLINAQQQPVAVPPELRIALYTTAGAVAIISFFLRQTFLSSARRQAARVQADAPL